MANTWLTYSSKVVLYGSKTITFLPPHVPARTLRFRLTTDESGVTPYDGTPVSPAKGTLTEVSRSDGIWDWTLKSASWNSEYNRSPLAYFLNPSNPYYGFLIDSGDLSSVTSARYLFGYNSSQGAGALRGVHLNSFNGPLHYMFNGNTGLKSVYINQEPTSRQHGIASTFEGCTSLETAEISIDSNSTIALSSAFKDCTSLTKADIKIKNENLISTTSGMFRGCTSLSDLTEFDTSYATDTSYMFYDCNNLSGEYLFSTDSSTDTSYMFRGCSQTTSLPNADCRSSLNSTAMFYGCTALANIPSVFYKINHSMFLGCDSIKHVTIEENDSSSSNRNFEYAFYGCDSLESVNITHRTIRDGYTVSTDYAFSGCVNLERVHFETTGSAEFPYVYSFYSTSYMFEGCSKLSDITLLSLKNTMTATSMFIDCASLRTIPVMETQNMEAISSMFSGCVNVESGIYNLYVQLSTQADPPDTHSYTFANCGINTVTGAAELAQIPSDWK